MKMYYTYLTIRRCDDVIILHDLFEEKVQQSCRQRMNSTNEHMQPDCTLGLYMYCYRNMANDLKEDLSVEVAEELLTMEKIFYNANSTDEYFQVSATVKIQKFTTVLGMCLEENYSDSPSNEYSRHYSAESESEYLRRPIMNSKLGEDQKKKSHHVRRSPNFDPNSDKKHKKGQNDNGLILGRISINTRTRPSPSNALLLGRVLGLD